VRSRAWIAVADASPLQAFHVGCCGDRSRGLAWEPGYESRERGSRVRLGEGTPFERLYELDAYTLLLGVGFNRCSSLHYAESLVPNRRTSLSRFPIVQNGKRLWVEKPDMAPGNGVHFPIVGKQFTEAGAVRSGRVGNADALLFSTRDLVDFAKSYFLRTLVPG
jgi:aminoglycoside N3'-acetyltransferase